MLSVVEYQLEVRFKNNSVTSCIFIAGGNQEYCYLKNGKNRFCSDKGVCEIFASLPGTKIRLYKDLYFPKNLRNPENETVYGQIAAIPPEEILDIDKRDIESVKFIKASEPKYSWFFLEIVPLSKIIIEELETMKIVNYASVDLFEYSFGYLILNYSKLNDLKNLEELVQRYRHQLIKFIHFKNDGRWADKYKKSLISYEEEIAPIRELFWKKEAILVRYFGTAFEN